MEVKGDKLEKRLVKLKCSVQNYNWGRIGYDSRVARLFERNCGGQSQIEENKHYAEFWIGTHVSGPSFLETDHNVLSVGRSLSIQAHPDKELAGLLHKLQPNVYKDANHKPEMALALTQFQALCGFITSEELDVVLESVLEFNELVGIENENGEIKVKEDRVLCRSIFTKLMSVDREAISTTLSRLISRLNREKETRELSSKEELVLKLEKQYPNDVGVLAALLLNHLKLNPGEAIYIGANQPHAYLAGECVECMASSDNVVRAGLTPKYMDVKVLSSMLTYTQGLLEILKGVPMNPYTRRYTPPFEEFEIDRCVLTGGSSVVFPAVVGPAVFVVVSGEGSMLTSSSEERVWEGSALFAPAGTEVCVTTETELELYRRGVNNKILMNPTHNTVDIMR
uniref:mannose-6-phosphate isomerase n=1 Tax=Lactuca sativa TaxID=4236 RepID=A0A9R1VAS6_LACSA|nr:hypothetical protein LSAT_V11C600303730 [Lactuca sativa]